LAAIASIAASVASVCFVAAAPRVSRSRLAPRRVLVAAWCLWYIGDTGARAMALSFAVLAQQTCSCTCFTCCSYTARVSASLSGSDPGSAPLGAARDAFVVTASAAVALGYDRLARARRTGSSRSRSGEG